MNTVQVQPYSNHHDLGQFGLHKSVVVLKAYDQHFFTLRSQSNIKPKKLQSSLFNFVLADMTRTVYFCEC